MTAEAPGAEDAKGVEADTLRLSGECRNVVGIWGDRTCDLLPEQIHCRNCPVYARTGRRLLDRSLNDEASLESVSLHASSNEPTATARSCLLFRLDAEWFAFPTTFAREVVEPGVPHRVPHRSDERFLGLVNVRGELLLCADLARLLHAGAGERGTNTKPGVAKWARMIIAERESQAWAFQVDEIGGVKTVAESAIAEAPVTVAHASPSFTTGLFDSPFGTVALLDDERVLHSLRDICR